MIRCKIRYNKKYPSRTPSIMCNMSMLISPLISHRDISISHWQPLETEVCTWDMNCNINFTLEWGLMSSLD